MNQDYNNYNQQGQPYQAPQQPYQPPQQTYQAPQQTYYPPQQPAPKTTSQNNGVGLAAFICGIVCFLCNPFYLVCLAAIILGIVGVCQANKPKGFAIAGIVLGLAGSIVQIFIDILTLGVGFFF